MIFHTFKELIETVQQKSNVKKVAIVSAADGHTLEAVFQGKRDGLIIPILIGVKDEILTVISEIGETADGVIILGDYSPLEAAVKAVEMVNLKSADFIMKGKIETGDLLKAVVDRENGLRTGRIMSMIALHEMESYPKLLAVTDGGMMTYPDLEQKKQIIINAVTTFKQMGYEQPKVAVLAAVEKMNPKMPETIDGAHLKQAYLSGEIEGCIIEGPISYDLVMSKESAKIKGYESPVIEEADILVVPNIQAGNILGKALVYSAKAKMAGFIVGAKCPIVLTSRGSTAQEKYLSLALCAAIDTSIE